MQIMAPKEITDSGLNPQSSVKASNLFPGCALSVGYLFHPPVCITAQTLENTAKHILLSAHGVFDPVRQSVKYPFRLQRSWFIINRLVLIKAQLYDPSSLAVQVSLAKLYPLHFTEWDSVKQRFFYLRLIPNQTVQHLHYIPLLALSRILTQTF